MKTAIYYSPAGNPEVWRAGEQPEGYLTEAEWLAAHPPEVPEPDPEAEAEAAMLLAQAEANQIITARLHSQAAQTETFSAAEFSVLARAGLFEEWQPGVWYDAGRRLVHGGVVYEALQDVTALEHQPPGGEGMLAVYRPLSVDPESGSGAAGTLADPIAFISGMDVAAGQYYSYNGRAYLAKADMIPCVWPPDTAGLWQWEAVNG